MTDVHEQQGGPLDGSRAGTHNRRAKEQWSHLTEASGMARVRHSLAMKYHVVLAFLWSWVALAALLAHWTGRLLGMVPLGPVRAVLAFVYGQATAWWANVTEYVHTGSWEDLAPPSVVSTVEWWWKILPQAFGAGTPYEQLVANIVLMFVTAAASIVTGGLSLAIELVWGALAAYAFFFRSTPEGDRLHKKAWRTVADTVVFWNGGRS